MVRVHQVCRLHQDKFSGTQIVRLRGGVPANEEISTRDLDVEILRRDEVAEQVIDYGALGSKIESLAQLKKTAGSRSEIAMLSLGRGYVDNCIRRGGQWTSGVHLYWWVKSRLGEDPKIDIDDLRSTNGLQLERQIMLSTWSIIMLRLTFIDDITEYARSSGDPLGLVEGLLDLAAEASPTFNVAKLLRWLKNVATPRLDGCLDRGRYTDIANKLHEEKDALIE